MPRNTEKVLMVQHASGELDFEFIRKTLKSLKPNDKITVLAIIQNTSAGKDDKKKKDIKEKLDEYSSCSDIAEIRILAQVKQVEFNVAVEAGSLNEVATEYAKKFEATRVHCPWSFSLLQAEEQNGENSSHSTLIQRLLRDKLSELLSSRSSVEPSVEAQPHIEVSDKALGTLPYPLSDVTGTINKFWVEKHSQKLQGLEDNEVKNGALSYMVKAMVYTIEDNNRTSKVLSKTEELVDENAKLLEKVGEMKDELKNLKSKMQTKMNIRDTRIVKLKAKIAAREEETEKAKKEATDAVIESITAARPDYDLSFLCSSCEDEDKDEDEDEDEDEE